MVAVVDEKHFPIVGKQQQQRLLWSYIIYAIILHTLSIYGCYLLIFTMPLSIFIRHIIVVDLMGKLGSFGIVAGAHRLWSHRSYRARLPLRIFLMLCHTMTFELSILKWSQLHRVHHKWSDTDADPHNSRRGFFYSHVGWLFFDQSPEYYEKEKTLNFDDLLADPIIRFQDQFYWPLLVITWAIVPMYLGHWYTGSSLFVCFTIEVMLRHCLALHHTFIVNSIAHKYGSRPYDPKIEPRDNYFVVYLALGEGYHNYHHTFPWDYSASEHGWQKHLILLRHLLILCTIWIGI
ncbi:stearoyl-coa desaturase 5-like [Dermatophagoides farinae]|uniref:Stearoyl-coa desaturase 5-like n=1 Tax=Dermatophagoides farinae TaxID=6954 RepID=A0A9D4NTY5_DERFA|nr:stearoyl-coa desaturase 5-like [Dermatophagoides farinae]